MGIRFRKSFSIGPLRISFSKSGLGFSIGWKGLRLTKKAKGGFRATASRPGTGLSYVKDFDIDLDGKDEEKNKDEK